MNSTVDVPVIRGNFGNVHDAALIIATAFTPLEVARWLVPDPHQRERVLYANMRIWVEHATDFGELWLTDDKTAVAVWFPIDQIPPVPVTDYDRRLELAVGDCLDRFQALDAAFEQHHPRQIPHHHLAFLAVLPDAQNYGYGTALLEHHHARLDREGIAGYLEASSLRSRDLYLRHGYALRPHAPLHLPDGGPPLWPMWRQPRTATDEANTALAEDRTVRPEWRRLPTNASHAKHPRGVVLSGRPDRSFAEILANRRLVETVRRRMLDQQVADAEAGR